MNKVSPGPWIVHPKDLSGAYQVVPAREGALRVCTVTNGPDEENNAHLIAASPALYGVLRRAKNIMRQHNLLSTATDQERLDTIARLVNWWNNEALPALRLAGSGVKDD